MEPMKEIHLRGILDAFVSLNLACIFIKSVLQSGNITVKFVAPT